MGKMSDTFDYEAAVRFQKDREARRLEARRVLFRRATRDFNAIVAMIVKEFAPKRIYQWGSLLDPDRFDESSDIDIAVEGIGDARSFLDLQGKAAALTDLSLDLIELEKAEPLHRESIVTRGRLVYERKG
jgi:predicted nucleotidyltransferase